ncbi:hypothetical protein [Chitinophaga sp.]|uniref:hypothetical protein n=1 Tax=Chitinophaga sp. TaxID=1869181 RepID=UPI0031D0D202
MHEFRGKGGKEGVNFMSGKFNVYDKGAFTFSKSAFVAGPVPTGILMTSFKAG